MSAEFRLVELGLILPQLEPVKHSYVRARQTGHLVFLAGQTPKRDGGYPYKGKLGAEVSIEQGQECAHICALNLLAAAREHLGTFGGVLFLMVLYSILTVLAWPTSGRRIARTHHPDRATCTQWDERFRTFVALRNAQLHAHTQL